jgi:hypothetical protein
VPALTSVMMAMVLMPALPAAPASAGLSRLSRILPHPHQHTTFTHHRPAAAALAALPFAPAAAC